MKEQLQKRQLSTTGNKEKLIVRLQKDERCRTLEDIGCMKRKQVLRRRVETMIVDENVSAFTDDNVVRRDIKRTRVINKRAATIAKKVAISRKRKLDIEICAAVTEKIDRKCKRKLVLSR